jgi:hypothetical protein
MIEVFQGISGLTGGKTANLAGKARCDKEGISRDKSLRMGRIRTTEIASAVVEAIDFGYT